MTNDERDELLTRLDERIRQLHDWCEEHKESHRQSYYAFLGAGITAALALAGSVFNLVWSHVTQRGP